MLTLIETLKRTNLNIQALLEKDFKFKGIVRFYQNIIESKLQQTLSVHL